MRRLSACLLLAAVTLAAAATRADDSLPTPESVLGHRVGEDFFLASYEESIDYFQRLAAASDRVELVRVGTTSRGRDWYVAFISSPENLANLDRIREISLRLAHPEGLNDAEAHALAAEGRAIVHIDGGLHATEVAHAQHTIQLAYDLASERSDPETLAILDRVVLLLWPSINPDGQDMVVDWYRSNLGTPFEVAPLPWLYQEYIGHDNNRDGYMLNVVESRVITRVLRAWEPQILYNHHQVAPFPARIWIPPFAEPISEFAHPLMWRTVNLLGMSMAQALEERGQKGAVHMGTGFDNWYPGFMDHANNFHNVAAFLTETGLYRYATPHFYTVDDFPEAQRDLRPKSLYASPWQGGWWRLRDAVDYMLTASRSVLDTASKYKEDLLYNRYQAGRDVIAHYTADPPYAYFIPREQRDPVAAVELLRRLAFNGIEVSRLSRDLEVEGQRYAAGTWVIAMNQPFAGFVRQLFAVQSYPDLREFPQGPPDQPYDVAGWTLPYQMDLRVIEAAAPLTDAVHSALEPLHGTPLAAGAPHGAPFDTPRDAGFDTHPVAVAIVPPPGAAPGSGPALVLDGSQNNAYRALNRAWRAGGTVAFVAGRADAAASTGGEYRISGLASSELDGLVADLALQARRGAVEGRHLRAPRVGLYRPWVASIDEGWSRWLLERYDFDFEEVDNAGIRAGALGERFDVIVLADISPRTLLEGHAVGSVPPQYAGGLGAEGARSLDEFVRGGGTLVTLNSSARFAMDALHLPVEDVVADLDREDFFLGGSLVAVDVDVSHPVMTGMPQRAKVFVDDSPVFTVRDGFAGHVLAKYPTSGSPLLSGYLLGEEHLHGYAAALDAEHGAGHVLLLGLRPQWRGQPFGTFRILFNAVLYGADLAAATPPDPGFWKAPEPEKPSAAED
jgi:Zinc carboxypeptidase